MATPENGIKEAVRRPSRFYPLLTFTAWAFTGFAAIRWPDSTVGKSFDAMTILFALMLREAMARSQDYYQRASRREEKK